MLKVYWVLIIAVIGLTSCRTQEHKSIACEQIVDPVLLAIPFESLSTEQVVRWIDANFPTAEFIDVQTEKGFAYIHWEATSRQYVASVDDHFSLFLQSLNPEPTIGNVLECYGSPDFYMIRRLLPTDVGGIQLQIWYPKLGLVFFWAEHGSWGLPTRFDRNSLLHQVAVTAPGSPETIMSILYSENTAKEILPKLKPWPINFVQLGLGPN